MCKSFMSQALMVWDRRCFEDIFTADESVNQLINLKCICRAASSTPDLLTIMLKTAGN